MKTMKTISAISMLALVTIGFSSCYKEDYNQPQPVGYNDDFDYDKLGWSFTDNPNAAYASIGNGLYKLSFHAIGGQSYSNAKVIGYSTAYDFLIQTRIKSDNQMGLLFGGSSNSDGYSFFIDDYTKQFAVFKESDVAPTTIINWQSSSSIQNDWNDLELEQVGDYWYGYINNAKVFQIQSNYLSGSRTGFIVVGNTTGYADYLTVKW